MGIAKLHLRIDTKVISSTSSDEDDFKDLGSDSEDDRMTSPGDEVFLRNFPYGTCECNEPIADLRYKLCRDCLNQFFDQFGSELFRSPARLDLPEIYTQLLSARKHVLSNPAEAAKFKRSVLNRKTTQTRDWKELINLPCKEALRDLPRVAYAGFKPEQPDKHPVVGYFFEHGAIMQGMDGLPVALPRRIAERYAAKPEKI